MLRTSKGAPAPESYRPVSANDQANLDRLESLGLKIDPMTGEPQEASFQGAPTPSTTAPRELPGPEVVAVDGVQTVLPFDDRIEPAEDEVPELPVVEPAAAPAPEPLSKPDSGKQTEEGLAKREADARKAQAEMSKTQLKLTQTETRIEGKLAELDAQIQKLSALQAMVGTIPADLNPADAETVQRYHDEFPEAVGVMKALMVPLYNTVSQIREQVQGVIQKQGEYFAKLRADEVFSDVYSKIPKDRVVRITNSPEFTSWLSSLGPAIQKLYLGILNETSLYTSNDALDVFRHFSRDTGIDIGLKDESAAPPPHTPPPPPPSAPVLRSGSALPAPAASRQPAPPQPANGLRPLSRDELANFGEMIRYASEAERDLLHQRLRLTNLSFDGDRTSRFVDRR